MFETSLGVASCSYSTALTGRSFRDGSELGRIAKGPTGQKNSVAAPRRQTTILKDGRRSVDHPSEACPMFRSSVVVTISAFFGAMAAAQGPARDDAPVVVDGEVRQVFRGDRPGRTDYLVLIDVMRSEGRRPWTGPNRPAMPAPGDAVYVHASAVPAANRLAGGAAPGAAVPAEGSRVRAFLTPRSAGGWDGAFAGAAAPADAAFPSNTPAPPVSRAGLTTEAVKVQGRIALRVTGVERGGVAQKAGLEVGDVIVALNGEPLTGAAQVDEAAGRGNPFTLVVLDVRSGKAAQVEVTPTRAADATPATEARPAPPAGRSLGLSAEPVTLGQRTALKVTGVEAGSFAAKAGIEVGDILVAANGAALTGPEQLASALRKSGPTLTLTVRDTRTGREVPVEIAVPGAKPAEAPEAPAGGNPGRLGAVTELAFYDAEAAVKVTEVEPGGPAARAGLAVGMIILQANDKPILHPDDLATAVRTADGTVRLLVVEPRSRQKSNVSVDLRNR